MDLELLKNASAIALIVSGVWRYLDLRKEVGDLHKQNAALVTEREALQAKLKALQDQNPTNWPPPPIQYPNLNLA